MSNTMPLNGGAVLKGDNSAVARKGANLRGPGEAMADRSRRRMKAASVSIGQQEEGKRLSEMNRRNRAEKPERRRCSRLEAGKGWRKKKEAPGGRGARKMA
jgi:hypothetical protein